MKIDRSLFSLPPLLRHTNPSSPKHAALSLAILACGATASLAEDASPSPASTPTSSGSSTNAAVLQKVTVVGKLDEARESIVPSLGATAYLVTNDQIASQSQGANAQFSQVILRMPGVAQDSYGQIHVRGEHANLQYRINDVILPEGISGFGQELDTRFVRSAQLITGSLPAQFGFRTAGIVDIHTKNGSFEDGGEVQMYGGSYDTLRPSFEYGGSQGNFSYFVNGSYNHNGIGIENPTASSSPLHDTTDQYKLFSYMSYVLDDTSRISVMLGASDSDFQIPNTPGLAAGTAPGGVQWLPGSFDSAKLDENQNEQNYYGVIAYQKSFDDLNLQVSAFGRNSGVHFTPDPIGDLYFNGVASDVDRSLYSGGLQADVSYNINDQHTLRGGALVLVEEASSDSKTTVFDLDPTTGNPVGAPHPVFDATHLRGQFYGVYLQDEWKISQKLTLNFGARFDAVTGYLDENQVSPRANLIYEISDATAIHAGYSRYFTPPPLEIVQNGDVAKFNGTSNEPEIKQNSPVRSERAHYFDGGVTQRLAPGLQVGVDGYYKIARNQLDDGLFGQTLILAPFNYEEGRIYGVEFTSSYAKGGFSCFANVAVSVAQGKNWNSSQFLFDAADLAYSKNNWIYLDHDQRISGSFGAAYKFEESRGNTRLFVDALYGSGLRTDATLADGSNAPNGGTVPAYYSINLGVEQRIKIAEKQYLKVRAEAVNVTDNVYELRNGAGVEVNAAQFGMRRGIFGSVSYAF